MFPVQIGTINFVLGRDEFAKMRISTCSSNPFCQERAITAVMQNVFSVTGVAVNGEAELFNGFMTIVSHALDHFPDGHLT